MSAEAPTLRSMLRIGEEAGDELVAAKDADELCRLLLGAPSGWGRSTRPAEAVELLTRVHGAGELPFSLAVLLVCTCRRWDRVTAKLIAAIQDSRLLENAELDELADVFLAEDHVISYPLAWASRNGSRSTCTTGPAAPTPSPRTPRYSTTSGPNRHCAAGPHAKRSKAIPHD
jgi:hypothetical protein